MKKVIAISLILMVGLIMVGCGTDNTDSIPQPPSLPDEGEDQQEDGSGIPPPPPLPGES